MAQTGQLCATAQAGADIQEFSYVGQNFLVLTICAPLSSSIDASEYPQYLDGLELAHFDPCTSSSNNDSIKDIPVGADHYWDLVIGNVIHGRNGPTAVSSKLGWLLSG